jgi:glutaredoxin
MKITMYTITECQFSKQEREYLSAHGLQFEEKNLETNREFLTEMLAVGSNFAGTPVTKIEKDDGQIAVLKGFTAAEFDKTLGFAAAAEAAKPAETTPAQEAAPVVEAAPAPVAEQPAAPVAQAEVPQAPAAPVSADPAMASVLDTLVQQAQVAPPAPAPTVPAAPQQPPVPGQPVIPDPQF